MDDLDLMRLRSLPHPDDSIVEVRVGVIRALIRELDDATDDALGEMTLKERFMAAVFTYEIGVLALVERKARLSGKTGDAA